MVKAVFLDRDGVINANLERHGKPVAPTTLAEFRILPGVVEAARRLKDAGFLLVIATNQPDVRNGITPQENMEAMHAEIRRLMPIDDIMICLHNDADNCGCRKPKPGLLLEAAKRHGIYLQSSYFVGDRWKDVHAGKAAGCRTIFIDYGYVQDQPAEPDRTVGSLAEAAEYILARERKPAVPRTTKADRKFGTTGFLTPIALVALWLCATTLAFYWKHSQLLIGFDGGYMMNLAERQFEWHLPLLSASMDWFQGLGDVYFAVNFRLLPAFIVGSLFASTTAAKVAIYEVVLCELSFATIAFAIALGTSRTVAIAAALVICLTLLPFAHPTLIYGILPITPHVGSLIASALLTGASFLAYGRRNWLADLPYALIVLALLAWSALVSVTIILLAAPFLLLCAVSGTIAAGSPAERRCKIGLFIVAALFLVATGPAIYLVSTIVDTAAVMFPKELANDRGSFFFASILFQGKSIGPAGPLLVISSIAGAVLAARDRAHPTLRIFSITLLTYLGSRLTFAILIVLFDFWRGPAPLYFEFFVMPLYAIFAVLFWARMLERLWNSRGWVLPSRRNVEVRLIGGAIVVVLALAVVTSRKDFGFPYPPESTPIASILSHETALRPGSVFRGRAADMIGRSLDRNVDWLELHGMDAGLVQATGNELRVVGLHYFGIPGLFQYTPTISPFLYAVTSRLLGLPGDKQMRSVIVLRDINPRILAMLGVRFVITDREYDGPASLRTSVPVKDRTLLLYEIADPNLGNYSPTKVSRVATATDIITRLGNSDFDPKTEIIADIAKEGERLVPARNASVTFLGRSLRVQAESDGRSILLLPLEFSRCLEAKAADNERPTLFRADLLETGILFSRRLDATLSIRTGPFLNPACRLWDLLDARALKVGEVPPRL
jgi:histidinol-phosphate phosphatase family protein